MFSYILGYSNIKEHFRQRINCLAKKYFPSTGLIFVAIAVLLFPVSAKSALFSTYQFKVRSGKGKRTSRNNDTHIQSFVTFYSTRILQPKRCTYTVI